jgi:hypothetical protein
MNNTLIIVLIIFFIFLTKNKDIKENLSDLCYDCIQINDEYCEKDNLFDKINFIKKNCSVCDDNTLGLSNIQTKISQNCN